MKLRQIPSWCVLATAVLLTAGCAAADPNPDFGGPWAAEFSAHYQKAESDFVRAVLEDGAISELEMAEVASRFESCLGESGIGFSGFAADGSFTTTLPPGANADAANQAVSACSRESGEALVGSLYAWIKRNPQKQDEYVIVVDCLVKAGAVAPDYTPQQYQADIPDRSVPLLDPESGRQMLEECTADPLGIVN